MLEARGLTKQFGGITVVRNVSFSIARGEILGYLGPNGSGKSTTIKMIVGLLEPTTGTIHFDGHDTAADPVAFKSRLGYVPEEPHLYTHLTSLEYLMLVGRLRGLETERIARKSRELLRLFELDDARYATMSAYFERHAAARAARRRSAPRPGRAGARRAVLGPRRFGRRLVPHVPACAWRNRAVRFCSARIGSMWSRRSAAGS
jgi:ABC-type Na+ transport system ATPase subunit NatA